MKARSTCWPASSDGARAAQRHANRDVDSHTYAHEYADGDAHAHEHADGDRDGDACGAPALLPISNDGLLASDAAAVAGRCSGT